MKILNAVKRYFNLCEKVIGKTFNERFFLWSSFIFVYGYLILVLVLPMLLNNAMMMWDHPGLYFSVWYQKVYVFPDLFAWNPYFYAGFTQNQFYPPLYVYISAGLSYLFPITISLRIMLALTLLLTPLSFYVFARALKFSKEKSGLCMLIMFSLLFLFPTNYYGGNLPSTFRIGLVTHAFGMMLFFFYFASLIKSKESGKFVLPTIIFSAIILSHIIAAVVSGLLLLTFIFLYCKEKVFRKFLYLHISLTFLLTAFWTIPFLAKKSFMTVIHLSNNGNIELFSILAVFYALFIIFSKKYLDNVEKYPVALFLLIILSLSLLGQIFYNVPFHFYRLTYFFLLMFPIIILSLYKKSAILNLIIIGVSVIMIFTSAPINPIGPKMMEISPVQYVLDGRTFIVASYDEETAPHLLQNIIPLENKINSIKGLYVESTRNGEYILNFEKELDPDKSLSWGSLIYGQYPPKNKSLIEDILPYQFNLFGINYVIISEDKARLEWEKLQNISKYENYGKINYSLYKVGDYALAEVIKKPVRVVDSAIWKEESLNWLFSSAIKEEILVSENVPQIIGSFSDEVDVLTQSERQDYVKLYVSSEQPVPVLVKISYFPNWKAYQDGKEIPIYRTSPDLMLIYATGNVELRYEQLPVDVVGEGLTLAGIILFLILYWKSLSRKVVKNHKKRRKYS